MKSSVTKAPLTAIAAGAIFSVIWAIGYVDEADDAAKAFLMTSESVQSQFGTVKFMGGVDSDYVEVLARAAVRTPRPVTTAAVAAEPAAG